MSNKDVQPEIRALIFDLGRVLVAIDNTFLVEKLFKGMEAANPEELGRKTMDVSAVIEFDCGRMEPEEFHRQLCRQYKLDVDFETFKALWCKMFYTMDGMEELVGNLSKKMPVGLLSDTDPIHWNFIRTRWTWIGRIANPTLSYEIGIMKPNAAAYLAAAENVNTPPEHCLFIDDLQINVDGARAVGMQAIRFESPFQLQKQLRSLIGNCA